MKTVLFVDDDARIRNLVRLTFDRTAFEFLEAEDGITGLELATQMRPDLIILDWNLPGLSGIEVARALRQIEDFDQTPIIMLTAKSSEADIKAARNAGAKHYLTKPFSPLDLIATVEEVLGSNQP